MLCRSISSLFQRIVQQLSMAHCESVRHASFAQLPYSFAAVNCCGEGL